MHFHKNADSCPGEVADSDMYSIPEISLFNLYVTLLHSSGRNTIWLLRDFNDDIFLQTHVQELLKEDERFVEFDVGMRKWWAKLAL